jgi:hypothetical protein
MKMSLPAKFLPIAWKKVHTRDLLALQYKNVFLGDVTLNLTHRITVLALPVESLFQA